MVRLISRLAAAFLLTAFVGALPAFPQTITTGDLVGVITDATGAVVPNATVTVKNVDTNETRTATTNDTGQYGFTFLKPGEYTIAAQTAGLKSGAQRVAVQVGQQRALNIVLNVQGTQEVVEVVAEAPVIQTENANSATAISHAQVVALPMNGGDLTTVAFTVPGVRVNVGGGSGNFNVNGIPLTSNLFTINGADVMDPFNNLNNSGASNNLLGSNEIAEAAVVVNAYSPNYGRMVGAQVNLVSKSGTNSLHGNAVYNYNDAVFNANSWSNNRANTPKGRSVANLYAASIGGPIKKNKLFYFVNTEALRYALPGGGVIRVPTPELQAYTLAHIPAVAVPLYQQAFKIWNGAPGLDRAVRVTNGIGPLQDSNNHLGCGQRTFATSAPFVNGSSGPRFGIDTSCALAFGTNTSSVNVENMFIAKADYNISANHKINFRYQYDWGLQATSTSPFNHIFDSKSSQPQHQGQMNHTWIITPHLVNNFIGGGSWYTAIFGVLDFQATQAAIPVRFSVEGLTGVGSGIPTGRNIGQLQLIDDLSWMHGAHTVKAGFNLRYNKVTNTAISSNSINGSYSLVDLADFVAGTVTSSRSSSFSQGFPLLAANHIRVYSMDWYGMDEWAMRKNVKVQFGMRLERDNNPICLDNCFSRMTTDFLGAGYQAGDNVPYNTTIKPSERQAYDHFQAVVYEPRLGIVITPFGQGNTVIRTGVGLFSNLPSASSTSTYGSQLPNKFSPSVTLGNVGLATNDPTSSQAIAIASFNAFEAGYAKGYTLAQIRTALGSVAFATPGYSQPAHDMRPPKFTEWSFEIEQPLPARNVLAVTYAGNHGYDETITNSSLNNYNANPTRFPTGFLGLPLTAPDTRFTTVSQVMLNGYSNYNGLSAQIRHPMSHGFMGQLGYTWSHGQQLGGLYDPRNLAYGYTNSGLDNRHQLTADVIWNMPKLTNKWLDKTIGGWQVGVKLFAYTGRPFSATNGQLASLLGSNFSATFLADMTDPKAGGKHCGAANTLTPCIAQSQFLVTTTSNPAVQSDYGNILPNVFYGPGYFDVDTQVTKSITYKERYKLQLGASAYNTFNHPNFSQPSGTVTSGSVSLINGTVALPVSIYGSGQGAFVSGRVLVVTGKFSF